MTARERWYRDWRRYRCTTHRKYELHFKQLYPGVELRDEPLYMWGSGAVDGNGYPIQWCADWQRYVNDTRIMQR